MKYMLLSNRSRREIMVLYYIIGNKETSLNALAQFFKISKRLTKETLIGINTHFNIYFEKTDFISSTNFGVISINEKYIDTALNDINMLKLTLLKENQLFNLCLLLTTNSSISRPEILKNLFVSDTYLEKLTVQLRNFLKNFGLKIKISRGIFELKGPEPLIRIFSFVFLYDSFQNVEWPFLNISLKSISQSYPKTSLIKFNKKSSSEITAIYLLNAIFYLRNDSGHNITSYTSLNEEKFIFTFYNLTKVNKADILDVLESSLFHLNSIEASYLIFLTSISTSDMLENSIKEQIGNFFIEYKHPYSELTKNILDINLPLISPIESKATASQASYLLNVALACSFLLEDYTKNFLFLLSSFHPTYLDLDDEFIISFRKQNAAVNMKENQLQIISRLLYSIYNSNMRTKFFIYIQMSRDISASINIASRIRGVFNSQNITITDDVDNADIILTDVFDDRKNKKIIYLDSINNREAWNNLLSFILQAYIYKQDLEREKHLKLFF